MLPAQNLRPESLLFVLATESRALNVVATSATTICFVSRNLIPKAKEIIKQKSHTPYYDKSNAKTLLRSAYQKPMSYLPGGRKKPPFTQGSLPLRRELCKAKAFWNHQHCWWFAFNKNLAYLLYRRYANSAFLF